jgi:hypothetical protein
LCGTGRGDGDEVFLAVYRERLRRVLAEAVPDIGGLDGW